jgi:type I restriction enzyme M protein
MSARTIVKSIQDIMRQDSGVDGDAQRLSQLCWMFFLKIIDDQDHELELLKPDYRSPVPERFQWRTWAADPEGMTGDALPCLATAAAWCGTCSRMPTTT